MSDGIAAIYAIFGSEEEARRIGREMVDARLAACANILGSSHSIYRWQGAVEEAAEVATLFKTGADRAEALMAAIRRLHSYETPAIVQLPVERADEDYRAWVIAQSREN
jgi:periplasmic divalent cation tolerance protein